MAGMSDATKDSLVQQVEWGNRARRVLEAAGNMFEERKERLIQKALMKYWSPQGLDGGAAVCLWAQLAEVQELINGLQDEDRMGSNATRKLFSPKTVE